MANLTQTNGLVKPDVTPDPMVGYNVVVCKKIRKGMKFKTILAPGDKPLKNILRIFSGNTGYQCFAVSTDKKRRFEGETKMTLAAQHQYFFLKFTIYYYVTDPKLAVLAFESDPLKRIQEEFTTRIRINVRESKVLLSDVQNYNQIIKSKILPNITLNQLRDFAEELGIIIKEIVFTFDIPEEYKKQLKTHMMEKEKIILDHDLDVLKDGYKLNDADTKGAIKIKETINQEQVENIKSSGQFQRNMLNGVEALIKNTDLTNTNPNEMMKNLNTYLDATKRVNTELEGKGTTFIQNQPPAIRDNNRSLPEGNVQDIGNTNSFGEVRQYLMDLQTQVRNAYTAPEEQKTMLSYIDRLLGEFKPGINPDMEIIEKYADKVRQDIDAFTRFLSFDVLERESKFIDKVREIINSRKV